MPETSPEKRIIALGPWLDTQAGGYVHAWEQRCLDALTVDVFGFNAVQIGLPQINALRANRMQSKWLTDQYLPSAEIGEISQNVALAHDFADLPFASQSLDLVVLPHVLEFAKEPHQVLREVERVLIPEGQVIVCGFNPASLWGVRQAAWRVCGAHYLPPEGEFISLARLKDWLKLLNMEVNRGHFGCYAPPFRSEQWLNRFAFMEKAGNRWWPYFGAVYMVQAIKRVKGIRLIGPAWSKQPAKSAQGVPVANKTTNIVSENGKS